MEEQNTSRRDFFKKAAVATTGIGLGSRLLTGKYTPGSNTGVDKSNTPIWRNKRGGMQYRMLGRTGMMVSELVIGGYPYHEREMFPILDAQFESGINYIDCAFAYGQGKVESTIGDYVKERGIRDEVFLTTKLSSYFGVVHNAFKKYEKELSDTEKKALKDKSEALIAERGVFTPGYHMNYFGGQEQQVNRTYYRFLTLEAAGVKDDLKQKIKDYTRKLLGESMERMKVDHIDVLFCPHGIAMPDIMEEAVLQEMFSEFKRDGLISASAVSFHNDVGNNLKKAIEVGYYDVTMFAYNIANQASVEKLILKAKEAGVGTVAMKVARLFSMETKPGWRKDKLNTTIPGTDLSIHAKAFLWALQNRNLSCSVAQMESLEEVAENLTVIGRKVDLLKV
ncbi:MAG: aldo/keto reductase [Lentimonas sp.]